MNLLLSGSKMNDIAAFLGHDSSYRIFIHESRLETSETVGKLIKKIGLRLEIDYFVCYYNQGRRLFLIRHTNHFLCLSVEPFTI